MGRITMLTKYLFVTGGVCSSLGKGLTAASIGMLLEKKGLKIAMLKFDPYLNVDPGTMNPFQHGEVYVTDDGAETDLDLGHYYRYTDSPLSRVSNATSGQIYNTVIKRERKGEYLGHTVQVVPHITNEIKERIIRCATQEEGIDIVIVEVGGTVGDIESLPFMEAIRQFQQERRELCLNAHLTYVPYLKAAGEYKTKPTQHSVQVMREIGLFPDVILCRCESPLPKNVREKISLFCNVPPEDVIEEVDVQHSIYEVPLKLHEQKIDQRICKALDLPNPPIALEEWEQLVEKIVNPKGSVTIGVVGKYLDHQDAYKSVFESLAHAAAASGRTLKICPIEADKFHTEEGATLLNDCDGCLVPGGFGERGWEGKIIATRICREKKLPFFGICLGMQVMAVEFARNVAKIEKANSTEADPGTAEPIVSLLEEQRQVLDKGGTMRLGAYPCQLVDKSLAKEAYGTETINERHRHRYEFNNSYRQPLEKAGLSFTGSYNEGDLFEIIEVTNHPWMVGVQFHPEFQSKPQKPHPLFSAFVQASTAHKEGQS